MRTDDYLNCSIYENQERHAKHPEFAAFFHEPSERYFFSLLDDAGRLMLRSEGYPEVKARDNGIASVIKNRFLPERYVIKQIEVEFYVILRAGNRQEIARSCHFADRGSAEQLLARLLGNDREAQAADADKSSIKAAEHLGEPVETTPQSPAVTEQPAAETTTAPETAVAASPANYLAVDFYLGYPTLTDEYGQTGYAIFADEQNKYYLAVYNPDGSIYLRTEAFDGEAEAYAGLELVKNNITNPEQYRVIESPEGFAMILTNAAGQEIARSGYYDSFTAAFMQTPKGRNRTEGVVLY